MRHASLVRGARLLGMCVWVGAMAIALSAGTFGSGASAGASSGTASPSPKPSPTPTPAPSNVPYLLNGAAASPEPIIFVLVIGGQPNGADEGTKAMLLADFTEEMQLRSTTAVLVPEPGWTLANAAHACKDDDVQGNLVLTLVSKTGWLTRRFMQQAYSVAVDANVLYAQCQVTYAAGKTYEIAYTWHSPLAYRIGWDKFIDYTPISLIFPFTAVYQSFAPSRTLTTAATQNGVTTTNTTQTNAQANSVGTFSGALLSGVATYSANASSNELTSDLPTWKAVDDLGATLAADTLCWRAAPAPHTTPFPSPEPSSTPASFCAPPPVSAK